MSMTSSDGGEPGCSYSAAADKDQVDINAFSQFFRKAMGFHGIPQGKLPKFRGSPSQPADYGLTEWLDDFEQAVRPYQLTEKEKTQALIDQLGGAAKEEILCLSELQRAQYKEVVGALQLSFGSSETVQSLSSAFHSRTQQEGESLADFSRALLRLYGKMEAMAPSPEEAEALGSLKDSTLKNQFAQGAREAWVRRELRRIALAHPDEGFQKIREEALLLFQDSKPQRQARVREAQVSSLVEGNVAESLLKELTALREEVVVLRKVASEVDELRQMVKSMGTPKQRRPLSQVRCYNCGEMGHYASKCPVGRHQQGN